MVSWLRRLRDTGNGLLFDGTKTWPEQISLVRPLENNRRIFYLRVNNVIKEKKNEIIVCKVSIILSKHPYGLWGIVEVSKHRTVLRRQTVWWRHEMERLSAFPAVWDGDPPDPTQKKTVKQNLVFSLPARLFGWTSSEVAGHLTRHGAHVTSL